MVLCLLTFTWALGIFEVGRQTGRLNHQLHVPGNFDHDDDEDDDDNCDDYDDGEDYDDGGDKDDHWRNVPENDDDNFVTFI